MIRWVLLFVATFSNELLNEFYDFRIQYAIQWLWLL